MDKTFYVIRYRTELNCWTRLHPNGFTLNNANNFKANYKVDQFYLDVVHEMWLDCLDVWPEPGYMDK